jgi:hypothetical protein
LHVDWATWTPGFGTEQLRRLADGLSGEVSKMLVAMMNKLQK